MAYKNNLLEYYGGGSVPYQGYQSGGGVDEETGEVSPWFPTGQFLGYDVPSGTGNIVDILTSLAIGGGSRQLAGIAGKALRPSKALKPLTSREARSLARSQVKQTKLNKADSGDELRYLISKHIQRSGPISKNPYLSRMKELSPSSKRVLDRMEADPKIKALEGAWEKAHSIGKEKLARQAEYMRKTLSPQLKDIPAYSKGKSGLKNLALAKKEMEYKTYRDMIKQFESPYKNINYDKFKEVLAKPHKEGAPNFPLAILKAYMGEDEEGYQKGGSVGNSLLGMQRGGYTGGFGGGRVRANLARYRKIKDASEDVSRRAKQIKEKKAKSGLFGKILGKGLEWGTEAFLTPALGPGAKIASKALAKGVGTYLGSKLGYGDKVGSGLGDTQWLASDRKKLDRTEKGLEKSFKGAGYAAAGSSAMKGVTDYAKSQGADGIGDYLQAKTGIKKNPFETPAYMQGPDPTVALKEVEFNMSQFDPSIISQDRLPLEGMQQKVSGLLPGTMEKSFSLSGQPESAYGLLSKLPSQEFTQEGFQFAGLPEPGEIGSEFLSGQYSPWGNMMSGAYAGPMRQQQGGMVRDDNALIDMMYRR